MNNKISFFFSIEIMKVAVFLLCLLPLAFCAPSDIDKRWLINGRCLQIIFVKQKIQKKQNQKQTNKQTNKENLNNNNKIEQHIQTNKISKQKENISIIIINILTRTLKSNGGLIIKLLFA